MYDADTASELNSHASAMQRVKGTARIRFALSYGTTRLADLYQNGSAKIRLPKVYNEPATAVLINTAGGLTGGDELTYQVAVDEGAHAIVTSQAAERAYRSSSGSAKVTGNLAVGQAATLEWLPQETILFQASRLKRRIQTDLAADARLLMLESIVLGRKAMGEQIRSVTFKDSWRIRRENKLVFADDIRFEGNPDDFLNGPATAKTGHMVATMVDCAVDAEDRLPRARESLDKLQTETTRAAASAWNGVLVARLVSSDSRELRSALMNFLTSYRAASLPRVWHC